MDPRSFTSTAWGEVRHTAGPHGYYAYFPGPVDRPMDLDRATIAAQSMADLALGRLAGAGRILPSTDLLIAPYVLQEALDSSRIEGTQATLSDVFNANATGEVGQGDVQEVFNYQSALNHGLNSDLPLSKRLMREMHRILLTDVRGQDKTPGEFRQRQNWIGSRYLDDAQFVPPPVDELDGVLDDWERYQHQQDDVPLLIKCGISHYQFETIHPFLDGNGRVGRLLIILFLVKHGPLPSPLLYVSSFFEKHKEDYNDRLQAVREKGEMSGWLDFFLKGVATQAEDAVHRAEQLMDLREKYRTLAQAQSRGRAVNVVDLICGAVCQVGRVKRCPRPSPWTPLRLAG